jgi:hypothetical protein
MVDPAFKPNRILANEPLDPRMVVTRPVVVETGRIVLPSGVLAQVGRGRTAGGRLSEGLVLIARPDRLRIVGERPRAAERIGQEMLDRERRTLGKRHKYPFRPASQSARKSRVLAAEKPRSRTLALYAAPLSLVKSTSYADARERWRTLV